MRPRGPETLAPAGERGWHLLTDCKIRFPFVFFCSATSTSVTALWEGHGPEKGCAPSAVACSSLLALTLPGSFSFLYLKCYFSV